MKYSFEEITYVVSSDGIATITMNRPKTLNAVTEQSMEELRIASELITQDDRVRAAVLTGAGKAFCAGGDLTEIGAGYGDGGIAGFSDHMVRVSRTILALYDIPVPFITAVNGAAVGIGMNIALCGDIILAAERASFSEVFGNVGLGPDGGGTYLLARMIGVLKTKELYYSRRTVKATEAKEMGFVSDVYPDETFAAQVETMAQKVAQGPTLAFKLGKKIINKSFDMDLRAVLEAENMSQAIAASSVDYREGISAFFEKRAPMFTGK